MQPLPKKSELGKKTFKSGKWHRFRRHFLEGKENWEGYYECHDCKKWLEKATIDLHHILHRSQRPDLIFVNENIVMLCRICHNKRHGIKVII